jgi:maltoporin
VSTVKRFGSRRLSSTAAFGLLLGSAGLAYGQTPAAEEPPPATPTTGETQPATPPEATPPPTPPPPADAPLTPAQVEQVKKEVASAPKVLESHGYLRSGIGINSKGGDQEAFQAPGAYAKYRLGNETETYGEIGFQINWVNPDKSDTWFKTNLLLAIVAPRNSTFDVLNAIAVREAYAEAGKVFASKPDLTFWAGQRFYRRKDVHINDFFHHDMSGYGGGFQDLKLGEGKTKLAVAYLGGSHEYGPDPVMDPPSDVGRLLKSTIDIRLYDIAVGKGSLEFWLNPTFTPDGNLDEPSQFGIGGGVFHFLPLKGGFNELSVEFGLGQSAGFSSGLDRSIDASGWMLRVVERATMQLNPKTSIMWSGVVQLDNKNGDAGGSGGNLWISAGARPIYSFTKHTGIAFEGGVDIVKPETDGADTGFLGKLTVAPLIRAGTDFWARPELRAFVTAAFWSESIQGAVGGPAYADDTFGLTAGLQMESWW